MQKSANPTEAPSHLLFCGRPSISPAAPFSMWWDWLALGTLAAFTAAVAWRVMR